MEGNHVTVCIPTRGMIMTETISGLFNNLKELGERGVSFNLSLTQNLPIPDAHTTAVKKALDGRPEPTHIMILEEDVVMPDGLMVQMLEMNAPVVVTDYPQAFGESTIARKDGKIWMAGTGCLMIQKEVFDKIKKPWFDTNRSFSLKKVDGKWEAVFEETDHHYAGQDTFFFSRLVEEDIPVVETPMTAGHMKANRLNMGANNDGCHDLIKGTEITKPIQPGYEMVDGSEGEQEGYEIDSPQK